MLHIIYCQPLHLIMEELFAGIFLWLWMALYAVKRRRLRIWRFGNAILAFLSVWIVLYATVCSRCPGTSKLLLQPFLSFRTARLQPEIYRSMLMNVFLFEPLGLTLSNALPEKLPVWSRVLVTVLTGALLSSLVEWTQYRFSLGVAEVDDVLCNTLGTLLGCCALVLQQLLCKEGRDRNDN